MTHLLEQNFARYRASRARSLGCDVAAFETNDLTIVPRPETALEPFVLLALTFGTGTVVSVEEQYIDFVRKLAPSPHHRAFAAPYLMQPLVDHAAAQGRDLAWRGPNLAFLPAEPLPPLAMPPGLRVERVDAAWRESRLSGGQFSNALGDPGEDAYADETWRYALALLDADRKPAAVAGAWYDDEEFLEIGVDVARAYRGQGLGRFIVTALAADIEAARKTPTYYCSPTNIRSQRTALSCGFMPISSAVKVAVRRPEPQPPEPAPS